MKVRKAAIAESKAASAIEAAGLDRHIGFVLRLAQVAVFKDLLTALKPLELRLADFSALLVIETNPGLTQQALGEALRIQRPNLVAIIDQLQARGLVRRGTAPGDRRSHALALTPPGEALLTEAKAAYAKHEKRVAKTLGPVDSEALLSALKRLADLPAS